MSEGKKGKINGGYALQEDFVTGKIIGIWNYNGTDVNGNTIVREYPVLIDPKSKLFEDIVNSDDVMNDFNYITYKSNTDAYANKDRPGVPWYNGHEAIASEEELLAYYDKNNRLDNIDKNIKKVTYPTADNVTTNQNIAPSPINAYAAYKESRGKKAFAYYYTYPLDLDPNQDHMKITKYKYKRPSIQGSRPATSITKSELDPSFEWNKSTQGGNSTKYKQAVKDNQIKYQVNKPGDSMLGSEIDGSVFLPMPKVVDTNGAEWGESELNIFGLAATSVASKFFGDTGADKADIDVAKKINKRLSNDKTTKFGDVKNSIVAASLAEASARASGQTISQDEFLARASGKVLNPNAELLFQGPVLRDFNFDFLMIARSREEGEEIRKIIRWLKLGMAPQFNNSTFLYTPDIFTLEYKRGQGDLDILDTVNRFSPGGLALRTIAVDYAPNGYWSAYQDSQPVAVKMSLNFAELRPIYKSDHESLPEGSVGY